MATKKKLVKKPARLNPQTGNVDWVDFSEAQIHPDHRSYENGGCGNQVYKGSQAQYNGEDELAY